jgi:hypothetical protein
MRSDMDKVIIERPRYGSARRNAKTSLRVRLNQDLEELDLGPNWQPSSVTRYGQNGKGLTDLLGPLKRFLRKQVGRPWWKVDQEIRAAIDSRTVSGRHLLDHLSDFVWVRTVLLEGKICNVYCPSNSRFFSGELYVDPRTGLLCRRAD